MWWRSLLLATFVAAAIAKDSYVVLLPKSFRPGVSLTISVNILQSTSDVTVTATLVNKGLKQNVASGQGVFSHGHPGTLSLQVPDDLHTGSYEVSVAGTGGVTFSNTTSIMFESKSISIFVQTDKAMYKPGQTVNFRAFAVFPNLTVYDGPMDIDIYVGILTCIASEGLTLEFPVMAKPTESDIHDANSNKIKQWKGLSDSSGVVTKFMVMDTQPVLGDWKIKVSSHGRSMEKTFTVAHYVLPKFEVTVELPSYALTSDGTVSGKVKAAYTYGKPVKGLVTLKAEIKPWYRPYHYTGDEPAVTLTTQINGEATFTIPMAHIKTITNYLNGHNLEVEANVTESLNNITLHGTGSVQFYDSAVKLEFLKSNPNTFKPGLPYTAYLKVVQQDDVPLSAPKYSINVTTSVTSEEKAPATTPYPWYHGQQHYSQLAPHQFTVPDTGVVPIQLTIPENATHITLQAHYGKVRTSLSLSKSYSPSDSYMQLFLKSSNLRAGDIASFDIKATQALSTLTYQVMARGSIVSMGSFSGNSFSVPVNDDMAPNARIIVYFVRADGEVVTDSISFDVDGVFKNKVSLKFDKMKAQPGENVNVMVTADPNSIVNLLAVDQSVLLLKSGNDITSDQVVDELKSYDTIPAVHSPFDFGFGGGAAPFVGRKKRMIWWPYPIYYGGSDAQQIFDTLMRQLLQELSHLGLHYLQNAGVKVITDAMVFHHYEQPIYPGMMFGGGGGGGAGGIFPMAPNAGAIMPAMAGSGPPVKAVDRVRSVFPETWLWTNSTTGLPDSLTSSSANDRIKWPKLFEIC